MSKIPSAEELARFISNNYCGVLMPIELKALTTLITAYRRAVLEHKFEGEDAWLSPEGIAGTICHECLIDMKSKKYIAHVIELRLQQRANAILSDKP